MQTKRIICPKCKAILDVKNSKNETLKLITCPSCKSTLQVKFAPQQEPLDAETYYAPPKPKQNDGATQLAGGLVGATQLGTPQQETCKPRLLFDEVSYPLKEGQNIVGRKGSSSKATVQIATADRYMSRQHAAITVTTLPNGTKKVVLSNYMNKNLTSINGQPIETGDSIRLTEGNSIKMGHTTVTFKLS